MEEKQTKKQSLLVGVFFLLCFVEDTGFFIVSVIMLEKSYDNV